MSYDIKLLDPVTREPLELDTPHLVRGGTYAVDGATEFHVNITYNYAKFFVQVFGDLGVRFLYGKSGAESIPILENAISSLADDVSDDYWEATEGNAKRSLYQLLAFAKLRPDGIWDGD